MPVLDNLCQSCQLYKKNDGKNPNLPPTGSLKPLLYVLGIAPDRTDDRMGKIFSGSSSTNIKTALENIGADLTRVRYGNAIGCVPLKNIVGTEELEICSQKVLDDIEKMQPNAILAMGEEALRVLWPNAFEAVYTITRTRGGVVPYKLKSGKLIGVVPTLSASYVSHGKGITPEMEQVWVDDITLAWDTAAFEGEETPLVQKEKAGIYAEPEEIIHVKTVAQLKAFFEELKQQTIVAFDFETTGLSPWKLQIPQKIDPALFSIGFAFGNKAFSIPLYKFWSEQTTKSIYEAIGKWLTGEACQGQIKIAHNLKFDLLWGLVHTAESVITGKKAHELELNSLFQDTQIMSWILDERPGMSKLKVAAWKYLGKEAWDIDVTNVFKHQLGDVLTYNAKDAFYTLKLYLHHKEVIYEDVQYHTLYEELMLPAVLAFLRVESQGCVVDEKKRADMARYLSAESDKLVTEIQVNTGIEKLNPASPEQMSRYFVDDCKYKLLKKTKKGWSVDVAALEYLVETYDDTVAKLLLELRGIQKLNGTYVTGLEDKIYVDGKIHGGYNLTGTVTGRTSSNDPNMQNFPKRKHKEVRGIIVPPEGYKIVSFDYGQIEARLFGVITADPKFVEALWNDWDIHLENSRELFGDERAKDMRGPVKNGTFALLYGAGDAKVAKTTGASIEAIAKLRQLLFSKFKQFKIWQDEMASFEKRNGYVESLFGKRRRSPMSYNEMLNHTTQSTASDMTLSAMNVLGKKYTVAWMVHDDLSFYIKEADVEEAIMEIAQIMLTVPWIFLERSRWMKSYVPLQVEAAVGDNWADLKEVLKVSSVDFGFSTVKESIDMANILIKELHR